MSGRGSGACSHIGRCSKCDVTTGQSREWDATYGRSKRCSSYIGTSKFGLLGNDTSLHKTFVLIGVEYTNKIRIQVVRHDDKYNIISEARVQARYTLCNCVSSLTLYPLPTELMVSRGLLVGPLPGSESCACIRGKGFWSLIGLGLVSLGKTPGGKPRVGIFCSNVC